MLEFSFYGLFMQHEVVLALGLTDQFDSLTFPLTSNHRKVPVIFQQFVHQVLLLVSCMSSPADINAADVLYPSSDLKDCI